MSDALHARLLTPSALPMTEQEQIWMLIVVMWIAYFAIHSLLASLWLKNRVAKARPDWLPIYRLFFNASAVVLVIPPLWLTLSAGGAPLWAWQDLSFWIANGLALVALFGVAWSSRWYDGGEFLGLRQWREGIKSVEDQERFHISPMHRFVRHPWYSLSLVLIWTRDMNVPFLITAMLMTLYFVYGSRLEERKLGQYHGDAYARYQTRVPGLIPRPWRYLTRDEAEQLVALARSDATT